MGRRRDDARRATTVRFFLASHSLNQCGPVYISLFASAEYKNTHPPGRGQRRHFNFYKIEGRVVTQKERKMINMPTGYIIQYPDSTVSKPYILIFN